MRVWTEDEVVALLKSSPLAVKKAVFAMQARQTAAEQASNSTSEHNGRGWSAYDAEWMGKMIKSYWRYDTLTVRMNAITLNKLVRYRRQLVEIANENEQRKHAVTSLAEVESNSIRAAQPEEDPGNKAERELVEAEMAETEYVARVKAWRDAQAGVWS